MKGNECVEPANRRPTDYAAADAVAAEQQQVNPRRRRLPAVTQTKYLRRKKPSPFSLSLSHGLTTAFENYFCRRGRKSDLARRGDVFFFILFLLLLFLLVLNFKLATVGRVRTPTGRRGTQLPTIPHSSAATCARTPRTRNRVLDGR